MKYLLLPLTLFSLFFVSSAYRNTATPDPEEFAKRLVEQIKRKDKQAYLSTYLLSKSDLISLIDQLNNSPYLSITEKKYFVDNFGDTTKFKHLNEDLEGGYDEIMEWMQKENIDVNELEYLVFDYELKYAHRKPFYVLDDSYLFVKHKDKYYCIRLDEAAYVNGRWVAGRIKGIEERDQYLNDKYEYEEYYGADSTAVAVTEAPPEEEVYEIDSAAAEPILTKKEQKLDKKIQAQQKKLWKLLDQKYK